MTWERRHPAGFPQSSRQSRTSIPHQSRSDARRQPGV